MSAVDGDQGEPIKLQRRTTAELRLALESGSVLVTGDPGAGKSASLFEVATVLLDSEDCVVLQADALDAGSLGGLRSDLQLEHNIVDVLENWPGSRPAYLVIDALDAARGERTQRTLLDLIQAVRTFADRWVVAASIRRFDLRYSPDLQYLFRLTTLESFPNEFQSAEFSSIRHFNVPLLTDAELAQLETLAPTLHSVIAGGTPDLRELVRIPFNLRLLADLLSLNVDVAELEPITTQLQLLDKYWRHRVLAPGTGDSREIVLRTVCTEMLATRAMQVSRAVLQQGGPASGAPIGELLSNRVLAEQEGAGGVERQIISFSHHVLFDYAVARLILGGVMSVALQATLEHPELLLIARPSYVMHFRYLWEYDPDRRDFWSLSMMLANSADVPEIGKIIGPGIAAFSVEEYKDVTPLLENLDPNSEWRAAAELNLQHLIGARLAGGPTDSGIPDDRRTAWCVIVNALSKDLRAATAYATATVLRELCAEPGQLDVQQQQDAGNAARTS